MTDYAFETKFGDPIPPGTEIDPRSAEQLALFQDLIPALGLKPRGGVLTPWARQTSDMSWTDLDGVPNVVAFGISSEILRQAAAHTFGSPVPFIAFVSDGKTLPTMTEADAAFDMSAYELYETMGVYAQDDSRDPPGCAVIFWARRRDPADPNIGSRGLDSIARKLGAFPAYVVQVPAEHTTKRKRPATPFQLALDMQLAAGETPPGAAHGIDGGFGDDMLPVVTAPITPAPRPGPSLGQLALIGLGAVGLGFAAKKLIWRK